MEDAFAGILAIIILTLIIVCGGGWLFALLWNFVAPIFWHTAPHLSWMVGAAVLLLLSFVRGLTSRAA